MAWVPRGLTLCAPRRSSVLLASKLEPAIIYDVATSDRISSKPLTSKGISTFAGTYASSRIKHNILFLSIHESASNVSSNNAGVEISTNDFLTKTFLKNNSPRNTLGNAFLKNNSLTNTLGNTLLTNTSASESRRHYSSALPRHLVKDGEPRLKQDALDIYFAGLEAVEPNRAVDDVLSRDGDVLRYSLEVVR